jgi:uncharacterized protein
VKNQVNKEIFMQNILSKELLDILACPKCKKPVKLTENGEFLVCMDCRLQYQVKDGIPDMICEDAKEF